MTGVQGLPSTSRLWRSSVMLVPAAIYLAWCEAAGQGVFGHGHWRDDALLVTGGPITAVPLAMFAFGAQRVSMLSTVVSLSVLSATLLLPFLLGRMRRRWAYTLGISMMMAASLALASHVLAGQALGMLLRSGMPLVGALVAWTLSSIVKGAGLSGFDRMLGGALLVAALLSVVAVAWRHLPAEGAASEVAQLGRAGRQRQPRVLCPIRPPPSRADSHGHDRAELEGNAGDDALSGCFQGHVSERSATVEGGRPLPDPPCRLDLES